MKERRNRTIFLSDCQSFYTSIEKADDPKYQHKPLVVAGDPALRSGIILAACPLAKKYGISTAERLGEAVKKCPDLIIVRPRMQHYIDVSLKITEIYNEYTDLVEVFSIDEQFLDMSGSLSLFGDPVSIASEIQQKVLAQTGVWIRIGISSNKMLAKTATDIWAKKMTVAFSCCLHPILQRCCGLSQYVLCSALVRVWNGIWRSLDYTPLEISHVPPYPGYRTDSGLISASSPIFRQR